MKISFCILIVAATSLNVYGALPFAPGTSSADLATDFSAMATIDSDKDKLIRRHGDIIEDDNNNEPDGDLKRTKIACTSPVEIENGDNERMERECGELVVGHQCRISCKAGYEPSRRTVKCVQGGSSAKWDVTGATCEKVNVDTVCRDKHNMPVDWFIVYRFSKDAKEEVVGGEEKTFKGGETYIYMSDTSLSGEEVAMEEFPSLEAYKESHKFGKMWRRGEGIDPTKPGNPLYNTLAPISKTTSETKDTKAKKGNVKYAIYSDQYAVMHDGLSCLCDVTANGHAKGLVMHDGFGNGVLLVHSQPKFPGKPENDYEFSSKFGQIFMCISFKSDPETFKTVTEYLISLKPNVFASYGINIENLQKPKTLPKFKADSTNQPWKRTKLQSHKKKFEFDLLSKTHAVDIYSEVLAKVYDDTTFDVVTWRNGKGTPFKPNNKINDVESFGYKDSGGTVSHQKGNEHSKWAVSGGFDKPLPDDKDIFCFSDLNQVQSQAPRGGGAICIRNYEIAKAFRGLILKITAKNIE